VVDLINVPQNFYNYFLNPPNSIVSFPYIKPAWGEYSIPYIRYYAGQRYHTEQGVGVLLAVPMIWISAVPVLGMLWKRWHAQEGDEPGGDEKYLSEENDGRLYTYYWLLASSIATVVPLLILNINAERHQLDFLPSFLLCASFAYGYWLSINQRSPNRFVGIALAGWILTIFSVSAGVLFALTGYGGRFQRMNPELNQKLKQFFSG
jgi:hypothetical protein